MRSQRELVDRERKANPPLPVAFPLSRDAFVAEPAGAAAGCTGSGGRREGGRID